MQAAYPYWERPTLASMFSVKRSFLLFVLCIGFFVASAQQTSKAQKFGVVPISVSYIWQNVNTVDFRTGAVWLAHGPSSSLSLTAGAGMFSHYAFYVAPTVALRYCMNFSFGAEAHAGIFVTASTWAIQTQGSQDWRFSPELGIKLWGFNVSFGPNLAISETKTPFISKYRVSLTLSKF